MRKLILISISVILSVLLGGCLKISTPEDMLAVPELNKEKKDMKEAVEKFRPPNTTVYPVYFSENKKSVNMINSDLDEDSSSEIISFYKNKSDDKIGMFILRRENSMWVKLADVVFETYEISNVYVSDLNGNNKKEIMVESYNNDDGYNSKSYNIAFVAEDNTVKFIDEVKYIVMKIVDIDNDGIKEIFSVSKHPNNSSYYMKVDKFDGHAIVNRINKELKKVENPYDLTVGSIFEGNTAVFIDYMKNNSFEDTEILVYNKGTSLFTSLSDIERFVEKSYIFNVRCKDIDNDGIIEVAYKYKSPTFSVPVRDFTEVGLVNGYFKINEDYSLTLVKEVYDDDTGYTINFPNSFKGKYTIYRPNDTLDLNINFINTTGREYPLIEIKYIRKYEWQENAELREDMQILTENQYFVIAGKVLDFSQNLNEEEKKDYLKMRSDSLILANITKERIL